jgi:hypothetical protein
MDRPPRVLPETRQSFGGGGSSLPKLFRLLVDFLRHLPKLPAAGRYFKYCFQSSQEQQISLIPEPCPVVNFINH